MTDTNTNETTATEGKNKPDWTVKTPHGYGRKQRLVTVGAAWDREDGGICVRLTGKQIVDEDLYLYPPLAPANGESA